MTERTSALNLLIIGGGMYVFGGQNDFGTIGPTVFSLVREGKVSKIYVTTSRVASANKAKEKASKLAEKMNLSVDMEFFPKEEDSSHEYLRILKEHQDINCVIISTPDHTHHQITSDVIKQNKSIMVVKPLTGDYSSSAELYHQAKEKEIVHSVEFHKRFDKANQLIGMGIEQKEIGTPLYALVEYSQKKVIPTSYFKDWADKSSCFQYLGVHYVDLIHFLLRADPIRVSASGQKIFLKDLGIDTYDSIQVNIEWKIEGNNKFNSLLLINWIDENNSTAMSDQKIKIIGTHGRIESDQKNRGLRIISEKEIEDVNPYFSKMLRNENGDLFQDGYGPKSIREFLQNVIQKLQGKKYIQYGADFKDAVVSSAVIEAAHQSLENTGSWFEVKSL